MATHEEMVRTVEAYVEAFAVGDPERAAALFAEDATLEDPVGSEVLHGRDAIREFYRSSMQTGAKLRLNGPVRASANHAAFAFSVLLNYGGPQEIDVIDTFRFDEAGKVVEMRAFWGPENVRKMDM